jgi:oxygen-independent coproporphyrinogen-3 oxidase
MRCGFCNLFTQSQPAQDEVAAYLAALERQMALVRRAAPRARFDQCAVGGGTPTFLSARQLERMFAAVERTFDQPIGRMPASVETSPATATSDRLAVLSQFGVRRISIGVQSFVPEEAAGLGRPQDMRVVYSALDAIRRCGVPRFNIDLIYGHKSQTRQSWRTSLCESLRFCPDELYLYPLYVRPSTGLARVGHGASPHRIDLYRQAREFLVDGGYRQVSLRCFRLPHGDTEPSAYACQRDGMIGLGCGARSYTRRLHYATRFAITQRGVRAILHDWISQSDSELSVATHGIWLSDDEERRRYVVLSLLQVEGIDLVEYRQIFHSAPLDDVPELTLLREHGWLAETPGRLALTEAGLERSEEVGPLLYSPMVRERLREFVHLP